MIALATALQTADIFWPAFVEQDGCVFLAREAPTPVDLTRFASRTAAEAFQNHVHVTDLFRHAVPSAEDPEHGYWVSDQSHPDFARAWTLAQRLASMWAAKLRAEFPTRRFRLYATRLDTPIVRFHDVRPGEPAWVDGADAEAAVATGDLVVLETAGAPAV